MPTAGELRRVVALLDDAGRLRRFSLTRHARQRMQERRVSVNDVAHGLATSTNATPNGPPSSKWRVDTSHLDGDELTLAVDVYGVVVVTVF
ncbi:MAG: DUF4258 domain-containing protein [Polyangiales bacterium]